MTNQVCLFWKSLCTCCFYFSVVNGVPRVACETSRCKVFPVHKNNFADFKLQIAAVDESIFLQMYATLRLKLYSFCFLPLLNAGRFQGIFIAT